MAMGACECVRCKVLAGLSMQVRIGPVDGSSLAVAGRAVKFAYPLGPREAGPGMLARIVRQDECHGWALALPRGFVQQRGAP